MKHFNLGVIGYGPQHKDRTRYDLQRIQEYIRELLRHHEIVTIITPLNRGSELDIVRHIQESFEHNPNLHINLVLPYVEDYTSWRHTDRRKHEHTISQAHSVEYITHGPHRDGCQPFTSQRIIDRSDQLVSITSTYDNSSSKAKARMYARRKKVPILFSNAI